MKILLTINAFVTAYFFGMWLQSGYAGVFMFVLICTAFSLVDYAKQPPEERTEP